MIDLTGYMWELVLRKDGRVRFVLYCAPKKSLELSRRLEGLGVRLKRHSQMSLRTERPEEVYNICTHFSSDSGVLNALNHYKDYWLQKKTETVAIERTKWARRAVVLAGGRLV